MKPIGFSTGALAKADFRSGIEMQRPFGVTAVELSALRDRELMPLLRELGKLNLQGFSHISFHAPSALTDLDEGTLLAALKDIPPSWPIIVHPDVIETPERWRFLGHRLCLENMDQRKPTGRTVSEMEAIFSEFPDASFCFDIGHARQVDPTMGVAIGLLQRFRGRLRQIHISEVDPYGKHIPISFAALCGFQLVAKLIPRDCPAIIESMVDRTQIQNELGTALRALAEDSQTQALLR
jgi:hypothetical protein